MSREEPNAEEFFDIFADSVKASINKIQLGWIVAYDRATGLAEVQPVSSMRYADVFDLSVTVNPFPRLLEVPVLQIGSGVSSIYSDYSDAAIEAPVRAQSTEKTTSETKPATITENRWCLLLFCDFDVSAFKAASVAPVSAMADKTIDYSNPGMPVYHSLSNAVALPFNPDRRGALGGMLVESKDRIDILSTAINVGVAADAKSLAIKDATQTALNSLVGHINALYTAVGATTAVSSFTLEGTVNLKGS